MRILIGWDIISTGLGSESIGWAPAFFSFLFPECQTCITIWSLTLSAPASFMICKHFLQQISQTSSPVLASTSQESWTEWKGYPFRCICPIDRGSGLSHSHEYTWDFRRPHTPTCGSLKDTFFFVVSRVLIFKYYSENCSQACFMKKKFLKHVPTSGSWLSLKIIKNVQEYMVLTISSRLIM